MSETLIKVENVSKKFCRSLKKSLWYGMKDLGSELIGHSHCESEELRPDEFWAIKDVSIELKRGECLGLIGRNGAGKTTLLRMLNGLIKPDKGRIEMRGRVGALIALGAGFNPILTGRENIYVNASILGLKKKEIDAKFDEIVEFAELDEFIDAPVQSYSSGMAVRLGFAIASSLSPDILLLDEVLAVGDVGFRTKCFDTIAKISKKAAIVIVSHSMSEISRISNEIMVMTNGKKAFQSKKLAKCITYYLDQFENPKRTIRQNKNIKIHNFHLSSDDGTPRYTEITLKRGAKLKLNFTVSMDNKIKNCMVNLGFVDTELKSIAQCYSLRSGFVLNNNNSTINFAAEFQKILFTTGKYSISVYFTEIIDGKRPGRIFHSEHYIANIKVKDEINGFAPVQLDAEWSLT